MIVPSMTLPEIRQSVLKDYETEVRSKLNAISITHKRKWITNGRRESRETILFPAKSKNDWRITIQISELGVSTFPYLISYNDIGITASHLCTAWEPISFMYFKTHFFQRYKERSKLNIEKPEELVKTFFKKNLHLFPSYYDMEDGRKQVFVPLTGGVGLGVYHPEDDIYEFKTFVDNSLLKENQIKRSGEMFMEAVAKMFAFMGIPMPKEAGL